MKIHKRIIHKPKSKEGEKKGVKVIFCFPWSKHVISMISFKWLQSAASRYWFMKSCKRSVELCRTSFTAARIETYLICLVKVWAHSAHHPAYNFPSDPMSGARSKTPMLAAAQKAYIPLVRMKRHHRPSQWETNSYPLITLQMSSRVEEKNQFLFEFPEKSWKWKNGILLQGWLFWGHWY